MCSSSSRSSRSFPAVFARGGTSNGLVILRRHLPPSSEWPAVFASAMGSPDPYGRQLNGMGSGISSTSKICILAPSSRSDSDVEFTFVQVGFKDGSLDLAGNCGNMLSAIGPISLDEGLLARTPRVELDQSGEFHTAVVRIFNTNTGKLILSRFRVAGDPPKYCLEGDFEMDGVPGRQSRIVLSFLDPAGAKTGRALPTGNPVDVLSLPDGYTIKASLVDVSNPGVFFRVSDLGLKNPDALDPAALEANPDLKGRLEQIRRAGAAMMGLDPETQSVPKIVLIFPTPPRGFSGDVDIRCLALSMGQAHKVVPLTLALCLGAAARFPDTFPCQLSRSRGNGDTITIGHPSGKIEVGTNVSNGSVVSAELHRTARVLMKGEVFYDCVTAWRKLPREICNE